MASADGRIKFLPKAANIILQSVGTDAFPATSRARETASVQAHFVPERRIDVQLKNLQAAPKLS
eukprot:6186597-Pleurochrysis_carterae.AAC.4